ncbi:MAG: hypothetical protein SVM79_00035 [Chloroflexota bacterium]|nr:hypothetical protein [Chloroflexota bacterium]
MQGLYEQEPLNLLDPSLANRTLGEVEEDEQRQWQEIAGKLKEHRFDTSQQAYYFAHSCIAYTYRRLGLDMQKLVAAQPQNKQEMAELMYRFWRIRVGVHTRSQEDELWQAGTYIYQGDELVAFISQPARYQSEVILSVPFWLVRTNVILPGGKGRKC